MDKLLTLEEVAHYLRVSERTVTDWANAGELPGGKIGGTWRFRKGEIQAWIDKQLSPHKHAKIVNHSFTIQTLVEPTKIFFSDFSTKAELLNFLIDKGALIKGVVNRGEIADAVFKREELMSTGVGLGIALPHVRLNGVNGVNVFMVVNSKEIFDYESIDNSQIRLALFFVVGRNQHTEYVKALSIVMNKLKCPLINKQVIEAASPQDVYNILVQGE